MSAFFPVLGALEEPKSTLLTTTSVTDILTVEPTEILTIIGCIIANTGAGANEVSVWWSVGATDNLIFVGSIAANTTEKVAIDAPIRLFGRYTGTRKIKAQAATGNEVTVTLVLTSTNDQATQ